MADNVTLKINNSFCVSTIEMNLRIHDVLRGKIILILRNISTLIL